MIDLVYQIDSKSSILFEDKTYYLKSGYPTKNEEGKYSDEDYAQANANGLIIAAEIKKAYAQGAKYVLFEKGDYFVCAKWNDYYYPDGCIDIEGVHNLIIDFNDSSIKLIYDSLNKNKYCTISGDYTAYQQRAWVMRIMRSTSVALKNLHLIGDAIDRSWVDGEEKMEHTCGITIGYLCKDITTENVDGKYFMGDVISGLMGSYPYAAIKFTEWNVDKKLDDDGLLVEAEPYGNVHSLVSNLFEFDSVYNSEFSPYPWDSSFREWVKANSIKGYENYVQFIAPPGTYTYQKDSYGWKVALYKKTELGEFKLISIIGADIYTMINISYYDAMRVIIDNDNIDFGEDDISSGIWTHNFQFVLSQVHSFNAKVGKGHISDCHRGGISNMPIISTIEHVVFENCGMDCGIGAPLFPDSTRYCYDQEEQYGGNIVVRECEFMNSLLGCLINSDNFLVEGCRFINVGGVSVNSIRNARVSGCVFSYASVSSSQNVAGWRGGNNMVSNLVVDSCTFYNDKFRIFDVQRRNITVTNCTIHTNELLWYGNSNMSVSNTNIYLKGKFGYWGDNRVDNVKFDSTTITSVDDTRSLNLNKCYGNWKLINTHIYPRIDNGEDKFEMNGVTMSGGSKIIMPAVNINNFEISKSVFDSQIQIMGDVPGQTAYTARFIDCVFNEAEKPIKIMAWQNLAEKSFSVTAINCAFAAEEDNIFARYGGELTVNAAFGNCRLGTVKM